MMKPRISWQLSGNIYSIYACGTELDMFTCVREGCPAIFMEDIFETEYNQIAMRVAKMGRKPYTGKTVRIIKMNCTRFIDCNYPYTELYYKTY